MRGPDDGRSRGRAPVPCRVSLPDGSASAEMLRHRWPIPLPSQRARWLARGASLPPSSASAGLGREGGHSSCSHAGPQAARGRQGRAMNGTCSVQDWSSPAAPVLLAYSGALLLLGLPLNGLALWVLGCRMTRWTESRVYMTSLAASDLCLLCSQPFVLLSLRDTADTPLCRLAQSVYLANRYMSIGLVTAIALDRYLAVRHPLRARQLRSPGQAAAVCAALWVLVVGALALRWHLGVQEGGICFRSHAGGSPGTTALLLLSFYVPLAVLLFCSAQVLAALARRPAADALQAQATRKAARMVWANLLVFLVCFLPLHAVLTAKAALPPGSCAHRLALGRALFVTGKLSDANCCLDAICYYYVAKEFQDASARPAPPSAKAHRGQDSLSLTLA